MFICPTNGGGDTHAYYIDHVLEAAIVFPFPCVNSKFKAIVHKASSCALCHCLRSVLVFALAASTASLQSSPQQVYRLACVKRYMQHYISYITEAYRGRAYYKCHKNLWVRGSFMWSECYTPCRFCCSHWPTLYTTLLSTHCMLMFKRASYNHACRYTSAKKVFNSMNGDVGMGCTMRKI